MDRNEKQNSHLNMKNTRGMNRQRKIFHRNMILLLSVTGLFFVIILALAAGYICLYRNYKDLQGKYELAAEQLESDDNLISVPEVQTDETKTDGMGMDETGEEESEENGTETVTCEPEAIDSEQGDAVDVKAKLNKDISEAGCENIEYWILPCDGEEIITNSGNTNPDVGNISQYANLFVAGALYQKLEDSTEDQTKRVTDHTMDDGESDVRKLTRIMLNREVNETLAENPSAAAIELVGRIGEIWEGENVENTNTAFDDGIDEINAYSRNIISPADEDSFKLMDFGQENPQEANCFTISDCIDFFVWLNGGGIEVSGDRLNNLKDILAAPVEENADKYGFVEKSRRLCGEDGELFWVGESLEDAVYMIVSVAQNDQLYIAAVKIPSDETENSETLAEIIYDAVLRTEDEEDISGTENEEDVSETEDKTGAMGSDTNMPIDSDADSVGDFQDGNGTNENDTEEDPGDGSADDGLQVPETDGEDRKMRQAAEI